MTSPDRYEPKLRPAVYRAGQLLSRLVLEGGFRCETHGLENVPDDGPLLIVANHQSFLDPPAVGCRVDRYITYLARASLFSNPLFGWLIRAVNTVPIRDNDGDVRAIRLVLDRLAKGEAVLIFPEGSRTDDGAPSPFREGAALIVRRAKCPVLPVAVEGAFDAWPRNRKLPALFRGHRIAVEIGEPIAPEDLGPAKSISARLQTEIESLRMHARKRILDRTGGTRPLPGPGDERFDPFSQGP